MVCLRLAGRFLFIMGIYVDHVDRIFGTRSIHHKKRAVTGDESGVLAFSLDYSTRGVSAVSVVDVVSVNEQTVVLFGAFRVNVVFDSLFDRSVDTKRGLVEN